MTFKPGEAFGLETVLEEAVSHVFVQALLRIARQAGVNATMQTEQLHRLAQQICRQHPREHRGGVRTPYIIAVGSGFAGGVDDQVSPMSSMSRS